MASCADKKKLAITSIAPKCAVPIIALLLCPLGQAMQSLDDEALSGISGRDGLTVMIEAPSDGLSLDAVHMQFDPANPNRTANLVMGGVAASGAVRLLNVDPAGNATPGSIYISQEVDVGSNSAGDPYFSWKLAMHGETDVDGGARGRLELGELSHGDGGDANGEFAHAGAVNYGAMALEGQGVLHLVNRGGPFNVGATDSKLFGELINGRLYYRQLGATDPNRAYNILDNLYAKWDMQQGTYGINAEGLRMATTGVIGVALDADIFFKSAADGGDFSAGGRGLQHFGWLGNLKDPELLWRPYDAADPYRPGVLNLSSRWNYTTLAEAGSYSEVFRWRLGETGGTASPALGNKRVMFETADWIPWGEHDYGHSFPLIGLDMIAGSRIGDTAHRLCWGGRNDGSACTGQPVNLVPGHLAGTLGTEGMALIIRDGNLQTYSRRINLLEQVWDGTEYVTQLRTTGPYTDPDVTYAIDWGLIYTFANVDGGIYLYPGGNPNGANSGIRGDILLMSQTFEGDLNSQLNSQGFNWDHGSHLLIADTNIDGEPNPGVRARNAMGIGLIGTSFLVMADDARLWLKPRVGSDYYSGGIDIYAPRSRVAIKTYFGGGVLPNDSGDYGTGPRFVRGAVIEANLEGALNARLSPSAAGDSSNYLGYSWAARLLNIPSNTPGTEGFGTSPWGSYISLAEPNNPSVAIRLAQLSGDVALADGKIDVIPRSEGQDNKPALKISHQMLMGAAAKNRVEDGLMGIADGGRAVRVDALMLGQDHLGRIVIPSAATYSSIMLEPQLAIP